MIASVARYAPAIVGGSALVGFGLSLGRDAYRKAKQNWPILLILVCLAGVYFAGIWLFRNYRTPAGSILKKLGALITLVLSCIGIHTSAAIAIVMLAPTDMNLTVESFFSSPPWWITIIQGILFLAGAVVGMNHRRKRHLAWEAEEYNEHFLAEHHLEIVDTDEQGNLRLRDHSSSVGYRLMDDLKLSGELEFMALGKRNKRGYMQYDDTGKYTGWSDLTDVR